jgi:hypothetical protein
MNTVWRQLRDTVRDDGAGEVDRLAAGTDERDLFQRPRNPTVANDSLSGPDASVTQPVTFRRSATAYLKWT